MGVTNLSQKTTFRRKLNEYLPNVLKPLEHKLDPINYEDVNYGAIGTAFDYFIQFELDRIKPSGVRLIWDNPKYRDIFKTFETSIFTRRNQIENYNDLKENLNKFWCEDKDRLKSRFFKDPQNINDFIPVLLTLGKITNRVKSQNFNQPTNVLLHHASEKEALEGLIRQYYLAKPFNPQKLIYLEPQFGVSGMRIGDGED